MNIQELTTYEVIDLIKQGRLPLYEVQEYINGKPQHGKEIEDEIIAEYLAAQAVGEDNAYLRQVYENLLLSQMSGTDEKENTKEQPQEEETSPTQPQDGTDEVIQPNATATPIEPNSGNVGGISMPTELDTTETKEKPTEQKQRGRKAKPFIDCFLRDTKQTDYNRVKALCENKKGKDLALVILVAVRGGIMLKPTFRTIEKECNNVGSESGFDAYSHKGLNAYTSEEIAGIKRLLDI